MKDKLQKLIELGMSEEEAYQFLNDVIVQTLTNVHSLAHIYEDGSGDLSIRTDKAHTLINSDNYWIW